MVFPVNPLPPDLSQRLTALLRTVVPASAAVTPIPDELPAYQPGERFTARIVEQLANGTVKAQVAGQVHTIALPQPARVGDQIGLRYIGRQGDAVIASVDMPDSGMPDVPTRISPAAKFISNILGAGDPPPARLGGQGALIEPRSSGMRGVPPVLPQTAQIATALSDAIEYSGVFYEAHQAQWVAGERPQQALLREPQASFQEADVSPAQTTAVSRSDSKELLADTVPEARPRLRVEPTETSAAGATEQAITSARAAMTDVEAMPNEVRQLLHQQLGGLAQQHFTWIGQAWPGQSVQLEIGGDEEPGHGAADPEAQAAQWHSRLVMHLPILGELQAQLAIGPDGHLQLTLRSDESTHELLRGALPALYGQMQDSGLSIDYSRLLGLDRAGAADEGAETTGGFDFFPEHITNGPENA